MTSKDYLRLAASLTRGKEVAAGLGPQGLAGYNIAGMYIADALEDDNPRFDRKLFLQAASIGEGR